MYSFIPESGLGGTIFYEPQAQRAHAFQRYHRRMLKRNTGQKIRIMGLTRMALT
jgi:hypothetical protein